MKYSLNKYLISNVDDKGSIIIFNTLYCNTVCVLKEDKIRFFDLVRQIIETGEYIGPKENLQKLLDHNIIISNQHSNVDSELKKRYSEVFESKNELMLTILPTFQCNFRCTYCYEDFKNIKMNDAVIERICLLVDKVINEYSALHLCWFGGEPLLCLDIIRTLTEKLSHICKKYKKPYYASITTNGYLLDIDTFKFLLSNHVIHYQVTIDGDKNTHNKQRALVGGKETYDVILNNLLNICKGIKTSTVKITIRINLSNEVHFDEIQKLIDMFSSDERFYVNIQKIFALDKNRETSSENYFSALKACSFFTYEELTPDSAICYAAKENTLVIGADGTIGKCTVNFNDSRNQFGNILSCDLNSFSLKSIVYSNSIHSKNVCKDCCIYPLCFGKQCPARREQLCKEIIEKYRITINQYAESAAVISLK